MPIPGHFKNKNSASHYRAKTRCREFERLRTSPLLSAELKELKAAFVVSVKSIKLPANAASRVSFTRPTFGNTWATSAFKNKEFDYKEHADITRHTHLHTHLHTYLHAHAWIIIIVIGFKQKHTLDVCYYWQRVISNPFMDRARLSYNHCLHSICICILSTCTWTQILDAAGCSG